ncbi:MAG: hypothetical protein QXH26_00400 [Candidatus Hadarchaeales archaeon]
MGQLDWSLEEKLKELERVGRWLSVPTREDVEKVHELCLQEGRKGSAFQKSSSPEPRGAS